MILPTSITPWYIWVALGIFGMLYAPYFMMYKRNKKLSMFTHYAVGLLIFSTSSIMVATNLLEKFQKTSNTVVILYNIHKNNIDNIIASIMLIQLVVTFTKSFYELYVLSESKKEKYKYILCAITFYVGLLVAIILRISVG